MKRSITWGALVGVVLGATVTFALARGWFAAPWVGAQGRSMPVSTRVDDAAPGALAPPTSFQRPLRPGSWRAGDIVPTSRS